MRPTEARPAGNECLIEPRRRGHVLSLRAAAPPPQRDKGAPCNRAVLTRVPSMGPPPATPKIAFMS